MSFLARCVNGHMYSTRKHGNTCPYCNASTEPEAKKSGKQVSNTSDDQKTQAYWDENDGIDPVVGWLVCIEGTQRGQDYKIRTQKNFIGRDPEMHIQISGDNAISRKHHAVISYNPIQRNFFLIPGVGTGLVYHNNDAVYAPIELTAYDVVQVGKTKLLFIPLCGIHFEWEDEDKRE